MAIAAEISGWIGAFAVLAGYLLFSIGRIHNGKLFQTMNLTGAAAMIVNGSYHGAWPSVATNIAWCAIGAAALVRLGRLRQATPPTREAPDLDEDELLPPPGPAPLELTGDLCSCAGQHARTGEPS
jgi:hypothetical protein